METFTHNEYLINIKEMKPRNDTIMRIKNLETEEVYIGQVRTMHKLTYNDIIELFTKENIEIKKENRHYKPKPIQDIHIEIIINGLPIIKEIRFRLPLVDNLSNDFDQIFILEDNKVLQNKIRELENKNKIIMNELNEIKKILHLQES